MSIVLILIIMAALGGVGWYVAKYSSTQTTSTPTTLAIQSQFAIDLSKVTPQFVDSKYGPDGKQVLSSDLEKIKNDVKIHTYRSRAV